MTGIESPGWRLLTDGGLRRQPDGSELAGWRVSDVSPDNFVQNHLTKMNKPFTRGAGSVVNGNTVKKPSCGYRHPPVCLIYKSDTGCTYGDCCCFRHLVLEGKPNKKSKKMRCERISCYAERLDTDDLRISGSSSEEVYSTERRPIRKYSQDTFLAKHLAAKKNRE